MCDPPSRRSFLSASVFTVLAWPLSAWKTGARYSVTVHPAHALVGDRIVATLSCTAMGGSIETVAFDDKSLELELRRHPFDADPDRVFPNRQVVQRGDRIVRMSRESSSQRLPRSQQLTRTFDLRECFPERVFSTGDFAFSFEIEDGPKVTRAVPARLTIQSGPAAVKNLLDLLDDENSALRAHAADLLLHMTAYIAGYGPEDDAGARKQAIERWRQWWDTIGRKLPWSFATSGAVFGGSVTPAPRSERSKFIGGVQYERQQLEPSSGKAMSTAIAAWLRDPGGSASNLAGKVWVADCVFAYPPQSAVIDPGDEAASALESALLRMAELAASGAMEPPGATILLASVARNIHPRFVAPLWELQTRVDRNAAWHHTFIIASELLVVLDPGRAQTRTH